MQHAQARTGTLAGIVVPIMLMVALVAGVMLTGLLAMGIAVVALVGRLAARLAAPFQRWRGVRTSNASGDGLVIEGSYVVIDDAADSSPATAAEPRHR